MKSIFGEYGKIIILFIAAGSLIFYLFYAGSGGFRKSVPTPQSSYGSKDSQEIVKDIQNRTNPNLTFNKSKLIAGETYDFTNKEQMGISAENADGTALNVTVIKMKDAADRSIDLRTIHSLKVEPGYYKVKYRVEDTYRNVVYYTQRTHVFVVD